MYSINRVLRQVAIFPRPPQDQARNVLPKFLHVQSGGPAVAKTRRTPQNATFMNYGYPLLDRRRNVSPPPPPPQSELYRRAATSSSERYYFCVGFGFGFGFFIVRRVHAFWRITAPPTLKHDRVYP